MNKKLLLPILIVAALVAGIIVFFLFSQKQKQEGNFWVVYENARFDFRVNYPSGWKLGEASTNNDGRAFTSPDGEIECHAYGFHNSLMTDDGDPQTLEEFIGWMLENETEVTLAGKHEAMMADEDAMEIILKRNDGSIQQSVYILDNLEGKGLSCVFPDKEVQEDFAYNFRTMVASFKHIIAVETDELDHSAVACSTLLSGAVNPLADMQTFLDENYTEVTITSRESWDRGKLPQKVLDLESKSYTCYPMPFAFDDGDQPPGMNVEPAVKSVEWKCELEYGDYQYVSLENSDVLETLQSEGYACGKEDCFIGNNQPSFVWLCTK